MEFVNSFMCEWCLKYCRCEAFNSILRTFNVFGNRQSPSKDIAHCFAVLEHLRFLGDGGSLDGKQKQV